MSETISYLSSRVILAETNENDNLVAKFCLCDFGVNHNGVQLNRDTIETWVSTLVNQPLVGRIGYNGDFTGHNMRIETVEGENGELKREVTFDTEAIGTFISAGVEEIDGTECVVGTAEIWRRYPNVCRLVSQRVQDGTLHTSWEILVMESHMDGSVKVIDDGRFTALCALGKNHPPAYDSSMLLEVAEADTELEDAICSDILNYQEKEDSEMTETMISEELEVEIPVVSEEPVTEETSEVEESAENTPETAEPEQPETENAEETEPEEEQTETSEEEPAPESEVSALTTRDLYNRIDRALCDQDICGYIAFLYPEDHIALVHCWDMDELEFTQYTYSVNGDEVTLGDGVRVKMEATVVTLSQRIEEQNAALAEASQRIRGLEAEVAELRPYRDAAVQAEAERVEAERLEHVAELTQYAENSGFFTSEELHEDGDIRTMIEGLNKAGIQQLIAERFMASMQAKPVAIEVASAEEAPVPETNLLAGDDDDDANILQMYINKK